MGVEAVDVVLGGRHPPVSPRPEMAQLDGQHRGLDAVEARTPPDDVVVVLRAAPVIPQAADLVSHGQVAGDDRTAVTQRAEVLAGEEREAGRVAPRAHEGP